MISYSDRADTGVNNFASDLLITKYFERLILGGIENTALQFALIWVSSMPIEYIGNELTNALWVKIFAEARKLNITMTAKEKQEFLEVIVKYNLQEKLGWIK